MRKSLTSIVGRETVSFLTALTMLVSMHAEALEGTAVYRPAESNVAVKYWVSVAASDNDEDAKFAVDGDEATQWVAAGGSASLTIDLSGAYDALRKTEVVFSDSRSVYKYRIEGSTDGGDWFVLADRSNNSTVAAGFTDVFSRKGIRFIRISIFCGSPVGIKEFKVFNYLRPDMDNGADIGGLQSGVFFYNEGNNPPKMMPDGVREYRGGEGNEESIITGNNFYGLVKDMGWQTTRLRVWNEPRREGVSDKDGVLDSLPVGNQYGSSSPNAVREHARYIVGAGQDLAIDFHYADSWSDPQNQPKPYAWAELPFETSGGGDDLVGKTYEFTYEMIKSLIEQGTRPSIVAIGNEISNGMMWGREYELTNPYNDFHDYYRRFIRNNPDATLGGGVEWVNYDRARGDKGSPEYGFFLASVGRLAKLVDAGQRAIHDLNIEFDLRMQTEMHFAFNVFDGSPKVAHDPDEVFRRVEALVGGLAERLKTMSGMTDRVGFSYYPDWHGTYDMMQKNIVELSKILPEGVKFNIAECSPRHTGTVSDWMNNPNVVRGPWNNDVSLRDSFTFSVQWQGDDTRNIMMLINDIPNNVGMGVWPWNGQRVYFSEGQPYASFKVWNDAFATNVIESVVYLTVVEGEKPVLPTRIKNLDVGTGVVSDVDVTWSDMVFSGVGTVTIDGVATCNGNMKEVVARIMVVSSLD